MNGIDHSEFISRVTDYALLSRENTDVLMPALDELIKDFVGYKVLTVLRYHIADGIAERIYSSNPSYHPTGGKKLIATAPALRQMVETGQVFYAADAEMVRKNFLDADAIFSLGCQCVVNLPITHRGRPLGQVNLLHEANFYSPPRLQLAAAIAQLGALAWR